MPWKFFTTKRFEKEISNIPKKERDRIREAINKMIVSMGSAHIKKLTDNWRLRVGNWRIFLDLDTTTGVITALFLERRSSKTY
ncbi:MAG: hypothetical protein HQM08_27370 [Candidatus Riflebacteria bacterium]|nr:hypothetical protein [Candidatus Riflebacteria bacterium]